MYTFTLSYMLLVVRYRSSSLDKVVVTAELYLQTQCDQICTFWKSWVTNSYAKRPNIWWLLAKTAVSTFWPTFVKNWASFYLDVWSHCTTIVMPTSVKRFITSKEYRTASPFIDSKLHVFEIQINRLPKHLSILCWYRQALSYLQRSVPCCR